MRKATTLAFPQNHPVKCRKSICSKYWSNIPLKWDASISKMPRLCVSEHFCSQPTWSQTIQDQYSQNGQRLVGIGYLQCLTSMPAPFGPSAVRRTCTTGAQVEHNRRPQKRQWCRRQKVLKVSQRRFFGWMGWGISNRFLDKKCWDLNYPNSIQFPRIRNLGFPRFKRSSRVLWWVSDISTASDHPALLHSWQHCEASLGTQLLPWRAALGGERQGLWHSWHRT